MLCCWDCPHSKDHMSNRRGLDPPRGLVQAWPHPTAPLPSACLSPYAGPSLLQALEVTGKWPGFRTPVLPWSSGGPLGLWLPLQQSALGPFEPRSFGQGLSLAVRLVATGILRWDLSRECCWPQGLITVCDKRVSLPTSALGQPHQILSIRGPASIKG